MSAPTIPAPGTAVRYHGSHPRLHGPASFAGPCRCYLCGYDPPTRYELLAATGQVLDHVRRESFTAVSAGEAG